MTDNTQLALLARSRRPKRHAHWFVSVVGDDPTCNLCGLHQADYEARQRRGRNNRKRGQKIQRQRIVGLGGRNLAGNNPNLDGISELFTYEAKSGTSFPERAWRWLKGIPHDADQVPVLIITDTPGAGRAARSVVIVDYDDWRDLHVGSSDD